MQIDVDSADGFISVVVDTLANGGRLFNNAIHVADRIEETDVRVHRWLLLTACVVYQDGGEALLRCEEYCGHDLLTADGHKTASEEFGTIKSGFEDQVQGLLVDGDPVRLLPGVIKI